MKKPKFAVEVAADLRKSGLSEQTLKKAGVRQFTGTPDQLSTLTDNAWITGLYRQGKIGLIEFPYINENGKYRFSRFKVIPSQTNGDGNEVKYVHPKGVGNAAYILPEVYDIRNKTNKPLFITEGEKKALALIQAGESAIGLSGVYNFRAGQKSDASTEDKTLLPELRAFKFKGRTVFLAFDADLDTNPNVRAALLALGFTLMSKGADVRVLSWPEGKGIDDFLAGKSSNATSDDSDETEEGESDE